MNIKCNNDKCLKKDACAIYEKEAIELFEGDIKHFYSEDGDKCDFYKEKEITFRLVQIRNNGKQRFYETSEPLTVGEALGEKVSLREAMLKERAKLLPEYHFLIPNNIEGVSVVCVSDASTHTERLVFAGLQAPDGNYGRLNLTIGGVLTFITDGGNEEFVYTDETYLKNLAKLSGYKKVIVEKNDTVVNLTVK